jgi:hypothetical protein
LIVVSLPLALGFRFDAVVRALSLNLLSRLSSSVAPVRGGTYFSLSSKEK